MSALLHDPEVHRLGLQPRPDDDRDLKLARYIDTTVLPPIPDVVDMSEGITDWGMLLNDALGDCTVAGALHMEMAWAAQSGRGQFTPTNAEAMAGYEGACGYVPGDPSTDQGGIERNVLKYWQKTGFGGRKILAFAAVDPRNPDEMRAACYLFGGVYLGVTLEVAQQSQQVWDYHRSAMWGGHAVPLVGCDSTGRGTVVTWGALKQVTAKFLAKQCTEAWAVLSADMLDKTGDHDGFDLAQLRADLKAVTA